MINISAWIKDYTKALNLTFGNRVWFMGLQGSYARDEATNASDIDIVLILDKISADDIKIYNDMLDALPNRNLVCGFLSGKEEILNWEPSDLFHLYYDTKPIIGNLDELLLKINADSIEKAIKIGVDAKDAIAVVSTFGITQGELDAACVKLQAAINAAQKT